MATQPARKLSQLEQVMLDRYKQYYGEMTVEEAFSLALQNDQFARDCGSGDPAFLHFSGEASRMLSYAELLEKEQNAKL